VVALWLSHQELAVERMLMSVKNCSRDVLVSRNSSQISLVESVSTNACKVVNSVLFIGINRS